MTKFSKLEAERHIRPLDLTTDLADVATLIETCFNRYLDDDGHRFLRHLRSVSANRALLTKAQIFLRLPMQGFVWEEDGRIIGNLSLMLVRARMNSNLLSFGQTGYLIANVATDPAYEGKGIAQALTKKALEFIKNRNIKNAFLQVRDNNPTAYHIYSHFGFHEFTRRSTWFKLPRINNLNIAPQYHVRTPRWKDWRILKHLYIKNYPRNVQWHLPIHLNLLRSDLVGYFSRSLYDSEIRQWALYNKDETELFGSVSWQSSKNMTNYIWVASEEKKDGLILSNLLPYVENSINRKRITLDYPYGRGNQILTKLGFTQKQNLIWMKWKCEE